MLTFIGFAEHIGRYVDFFPRLAAPPSSLHITAFDQRGHGLTSLRPLTLSSPEVQAWQSEGKTVKLEGDKAKRRTGGWARVMPDIEWFVQRESERAKQTGVKLFLWGFSMVSQSLPG
jgi:acylglycerol lipase